MSRNVWNSPSGCFMVDMRISSNIIKSPSPKCYMTFWDMTIYNDILNWSDITPICKLITEHDFITDFDLLQITSKLLTQGYRYHKLRKTFGKFFWSYSELLSKFGDITFQEYVLKGISHLVFYGDLVYKLRRVKDTPNFISSGSNIVKRLRRRQYDPLIIETTIGLVLGPCTALCRLFLKLCTLTNKAVGTIWRALSKPPQRRQGPDLRSLWLLVGTPSAIRPELAFSRAEHSLPYSDVTIYIFAILYLSFVPYV